MRGGPQGSSGKEALCAAHLLGQAGVELIQALDHVAPVQHGRPVLAALVEHKVPEQLQQVPVTCRAAPRSPVSLVSCH